MKHMTQILLLTALVCLVCHGAMAAAPATPTPAPVPIAQRVSEPPEQIRQVLELAYHEWSTLAGKTLPKVN